MREKKNKQEYKNICIECDAPCCQDLAIPTTRPRSRYEIDQMKWYLHFDVVKVFIRHHRWYLLIEGSRCKYLDKNSMCTRYDARPQVCRDHNPPACERFGEFWDVMITTPEELDAYLKPKKRKGKR